MGTIKKGKIVFDNAKGLVGAVPQGFEMEFEGGDGGEVTSVNTKKGDVVLIADDILVENGQSIQKNLERIDDDVANINDQLPTLGGTKLYHHVVSFTQGESENNFKLRFISTSNSEITGSYPLCQLFLEGKVFQIVIEELTFHDYGILKSVNSTTTEFTFSGDYAFDPDSSVSSDVVTPL